MKRILLVLCVALAILFIAGWAFLYTHSYHPPLTVDCRYIAPEGFDEIAGRSDLSEEDLKAWISRTFGVDMVQIDATLSSKSSQGIWLKNLHWEKNGNGGFVELADGVPYQAAQYWQQSAPSFEQAVSCLGQPEQFSVEYGPGLEWLPPLFGINFYYPERGIFLRDTLVQTWRDPKGVDGELVFARGATPGNTPIRRIDMYPSGKTIEALVRDSYRYSYCGQIVDCPESAIETTLSRIRPFVGSVSEIRYSISKP